VQLFTSPNSSKAARRESSFVAQASPPIKTRDIGFVGKEKKRENDGGLCQALLRS
jgi:hypothetical protein